MSERRQKELDYMKSREQLVAENEEMLRNQRIQDAEEYNQVKVKLETDVQVPPQEDFNQSNQFNQSIRIKVILFSSSSRQLVRTYKYVFGI